MHKIIWIGAGLTVAGQIAMDAWMRRDPTPLMLLSAVTWLLSGLSALTADRYEAAQRRAERLIEEPDDGNPYAEQAKCERTEP